MENREFIHLHTLTPEVVHKREPAEYAVPTFDGRGSSSVRHPLNDFTGQLIHSRILLVVLDSYPSFYLKGGFKSVTFPYSCYDALQVTRAHTHKDKDRYIVDHPCPRTGQQVYTELKRRGCRHGMGVGFQIRPWEGQRGPGYSKNPTKKGLFEVTSSTSVWIL